MKYSGIVARFWFCLLSHFLHTQKFLINFGCLLSHFLHFLLNSRTEDEILPSKVFLCGEYIKDGASAGN